MTSDRGTQWQHVKRLVDEALDRPPGEREAFLEAACDDGAIRTGAAELLEAYTDTPSYLDGGVEALFFEAEPASLAGRRLGAYQLVAEIGRGGMGTVYRAERADGQFEQTVALKVLRRGLDTEDILRRFLAERQILATLDHPHVARLLDGGSTPDSRPYFVMEQVEGVPIDDYCEAERLPVDERLRLFLKVGAAVQHAHQRLIVHRDLKPSNVLVTADGQPKLLDFGIAKLLAETAPEEAPRTRPGQRWLTPEYAAPEQVKGEPISTATDVYQLGLLLYTLLTGRPPLSDRRRRNEEATAFQIGRPSTAARRRPPADGQAANARRLARRLRGDLDTITMKALREEPDRRYGSVEAFVEDVRRHLDGLPVKARPATVTYRVNKFVRRHRTGVAAAVLVTLLLAGYAATVTVQARRIARERDLAEAAKTFLVELFQGADPEQHGGPVRAQDLLDEGVKRLRTEMADQPAMRADLMNVIGSAYRGIGRYREALALHRQALNTNRRLFGPESRAVADTKNSLGEVLFYLGRYDEAEALYQTSLDLRRRLLPAGHVDLAQSLNNLALLDVVHGDYTRAEERLREARTIFVDQLESDHWRIANATNNLAYVLRMQGAFDEAEQSFREALAMHRRINGNDHRDVAGALVNLGNVLRLQGTLDEAERAYHEAMRILRRIADEDTPYSAAALLGLGRVQQASGTTAEAEATYRKALAAYRRALPPDHYRQALARTALGTLLTETGRAHAAEPMLRDALHIARIALPEGHERVARVQSALGLCLTQSGRYTEAESLLVAAHRILVTERGPKDRMTEATRRRLIALYEAWGKSARAARYRRVRGEVIDTRITGGDSRG